MNYETLENCGPVGLMFGSYNPPHEGHVKTAENLKTGGGLREVWLLPIPQSPFKRGTPQASFDDKVAMCRILATPHESWLKVSDSCRDFQSGAVRQLQQYKRTLETVFNHHSGMSFKILGGEDFSRRLNIAVSALAFLGMVGKLGQKTSPLQLPILSEYAIRIKRAYDVLSGVEVLSAARSAIAEAGNNAEAEISSSKIRNALASGHGSITGLTSELEGYIRGKGLYTASSAEKRTQISFR